MFSRYRREFTGKGILMEERNEYVHVGVSGGGGGGGGASNGITNPLTKSQWMFFSFMGGLIYGYNVSLGATLQYIRDTLDLSASEEEIASASATLSDSISMIVGGHLADQFGRKRTAMFACICSILGSLLTALLSENYTWLLLGRMVTGIGNGLSILVIPMYIGECVPSIHRGLFVSLYQLGVTSGCCFPYLVMIFITEQWRFALALGCLPGVYVWYYFHHFFPESAKWLKWKENPNENPLEKQEQDIDDQEVLVVEEEEDNTETKPLRRNHHHHHHHPDISTSPRLELCIGILLAYVNNCIDHSLFYGPEIFAKTMKNFTKKDANMIGLICSLLPVVSVYITGHFLIEKFPRRQIYLCSLFLVMICFLLSSLLFFVYTEEEFGENLTAKFCLILTFNCMVIFAAIGPGTLFVVILSELFHSNQYRAKYTSYCTFSMSFFALLVNGTLLSFFNWFGTSTTFFGYGISYAAAFCFLYQYLPETKQRQLV